MSDIDRLTVLHSAGPVMAKTWLADGSIAPYQNARQFRPEAAPVADIQELALLLAVLESLPQACLVRGEYIGSDQASAELERQREVLKSGHTLRSGDFFKDQALHWLMIDVDRFVPAAGDPVHAPEEAAHEFIKTHLPAAFQEASFIWALSGSAGHSKSAGLLKMHLHFWLAKPQTSAALAAWAKTFPPGVIDGSLYSPVQIHYTAAPVFAEGVVDPVPVRSGFHESPQGRHEVDLVIDPQVLATARAWGRSIEPMADPTQKPGLIGAFCRAFKPQDLAELVPAQFEPSRREGHFSWLEHSPDGVFITGCERGLVSGHGTAPTGQNRACNVYDFVRLHLFADRDQDAPPDARPSELPSVAAMRDWIAQQHPEVLDDVRHNTSSPEQDFGFLDADDGLPEPAHADAARQPKNPLRVWRPAELRSRPPARWLIKKTLPQQGVASLVGDSNVGKSFCALDMGLAVARGKPWFGFPVQQGAVLYVAAEGGYGFSGRLEAYATHHDVDLDAVPFGLIDVGLDLRTSAADAERIVDAAKSLERKSGAPMRLIVLDTLARMISGGDENSSSDMGHVLAMANRIAERTGALVLIVHHTGKDAQKGARGHSSFRAALDTQLIVRKEYGRCTVTLDKQRDGPTDLRFSYRLESVDLGASEDGLESRTSAVLIPLIEGTEFDIEPAKLGKWQAVALEALQACAAEGDGRVLRESVFRRVEQQREANGTALPPTWRKQLERALKELASEGGISADGPYLAERGGFPERKAGQALH